MNRDAKVVSYRIIAMEAFLRYSIIEEATQARVRHKLIHFWRMKGDEIGTILDSKKGVVNYSIMKKFKRRFVMSSRWYKMIDGVKNIERYFTPKLFRKRGKYKKCANKIRIWWYFCQMTTMCKLWIHELLLSWICTTQVATLVILRSHSKVSDHGLLIFAATRFYQHLIVDLVLVDACRVTRYRASQISQE